MLDEHRPEVPQIGNHVDGEQRRAAPLPQAAEPTRSRNATPIHLPSISQQHPPPAQDGMISQLQSSLQSQLHVHSQILEEQRQEIDNQRHHLSRIDGAMEALHHELRNIYAMIEGVKHEVRARGPVTDHTNSSEVDILTEQVQTIGAKANEVVGLKMQLDILRSQVRRLERHDSPGASGPTSIEPSAHEQARHAPPPANAFTTSTPSGPDQRSLLYHSPMENRLPAPIAVNSELPDPRLQSESRTLPGIHSIDPSRATPLSSWRPAGGIAPPPTLAPLAGSSPQIEASAPGSGWAAVNTNLASKRLISEPSFDSSASGSPKRQRLAPLMPRAHFDQHHTGHSSSPYHSVSSETLPTVPTLQSTQNPSMESTGSIPSANNMRFVQFASGLENTAEEAWRQDAARPGPAPLLDRSQGSPRRGRGGKIRSGRRSGGGEGERATPDWETRSDYMQSINSATEMHAEAAPASEQVSETTAGMYPDPHFMPVTTTADLAPSNHPTKKTRTKPVRNSDGILIRKDGRPDMRSVSSAMNLKKVHAKKEAERAINKETSAASDDAKDNEASDQDDQDMSVAASPERATDTENNNTLDRHQETMRKVFPYGIEGAGVSGTSSPSNMAQQFFPKADDNRAAPPVKIEAMLDSETTTSKHDAPHGKQDSKPLIDGERSMVHHHEGRVDVDMDDAK
jgi:hypothetical protein